MPHYTMGVDPSTWPTPDDVDLIQQQEAYETSHEFTADVRDWMDGDGATFLYAADRYTLTDAYERGFRIWLDRQMP